jgi:hypothetical protein
LRIVNEDEEQRAGSGASEQVERRQGNEEGFWRSKRRCHTKGCIERTMLRIWQVRYVVQNWPQKLVQPGKG